MTRKTVKQGRDELAHRARELLAPFSHQRSFQPGDLIFCEGDDAGMLVAIESGRVKIDRVLPGGNAVTLYLSPCAPGSSPRPSASPRRASRVQ